MELVFQYLDELIVGAAHWNQWGKLEKMVRSMSYNKFANRSGVVPWEEYSHVALYLKNGKRFTLTSLLINDPRLPNDDEKIFTKQNFYRLAKNYS